MTVGETFSDWYDRMKSAISETIGPGQQKGEELDSCVRQVMAQGHDRESAYAICNDTLKADLEKSERDELLDTAREMSKYDPQVPLTYGNLVEYAGVDVKGEDELELPKSCRRCNTATRIKGSFMCPDCDPSINPETDEFELVGSGVQEAKGEDGEETEKADDHAATPTRKVYLTPSTAEDVPGDAQVKSDDRGLYYEESVDGVDQKADPMANGHDLDPETGEGTCEATGETITAETMQDLTGDCPHCGEALSVIDAKADTDEGETGADLFLVRPGEDEADQYEADVLGVGVDFPESGVYIDWYLEAFPDPLDEGHVSEYGSLEDFKKASGNQVEIVETYRAPVAQKLAAKAVPDNAVRIDSRGEAPDGAKVIEGDRGGLYYLPPDEGGEGDAGEAEIEAGDELEADQLEEGMEVEIHGDPATINAVEEDENGTVVAFTNHDEGEDYAIFADLLEGDIRATEETQSSGEEPGGGGQEEGEQAPDDGVEPDGVSPEELGEEHVGREVSFTSSRGPTEGEFLGLEERPGRNDEGQQAVVQGDAFVPSRIPLEEIEGEVAVGGEDEPDTEPEPEPEPEPEGDGQDDEPADPEERWGSITENFGAGQDVPEAVDVSQAESVSSLEEMGIEGGQDEAAMRVAEMPDGSRAFVRDGEAMKQDPAKAAAAGSFLEGVGANVATQHYDEETNALAVEEVDGELMSEVEPGAVDEDSFYDAVAASMLAGNADLHDANLMVGDDGEVTLFDLDRGGGRLFASGDEDQEVSQEMWQDQDVAHFYTNEAAMEHDFEAELPMQEIQQRVQEMREEAAEVAEDLPDNEAGDAIRQNIEASGREEAWL